mmetsp:Transcript_53456/g.88691  ORF Transcript_53456/g.88691 Transcript_53456/m.88691 type:complete len:162 (+) Transcript_53456:2-487(+)
MYDDEMDDTVFIDDDEDFFQQTLRKEIELELRQSIKQEIEHHFEIRAQQIRVDAHIERQKETQKFQTEMEGIRNELSGLTEKYNSLKQKYKTETKRYKQKIIDLSNSNRKRSDSNDAYDIDENGRTRNQRARTRHLTRHQVCGVTPSCTMPKLSWLFSGRK